MAVDCQDKDELKITQSYACKPKDSGCANVGAHIARRVK